MTREDWDVNDFGGFDDEYGMPEDDCDEFERTQLVADEAAGRAEEEGFPGVPCRRCSECRGQKHHWLQPEHDPNTDRVFFPCKHCDAEAECCVRCEERGELELVPAEHDYHGEPICPGCHDSIGEAQDARAAEET